MIGKKYLNPIKIDVPNDPSSGAFFSALTLLNKDSSLIIKKLGLNPSRTGFYKILKKQGANIIFKNLKKNNNELQGDVLVKSSNLKPIHASKSYYTNMTDEYPILFVIAALTALHLTALHQAGSSNPLGTISNTDKIPFHPYFTVKDLFGAVVFVMFFSF